jgi:hypothetical protein
VRLVHDDRIPALGDFCLPCFGLLLFFRAGFIRPLRAGGMKQPAKHEWKFLQGGDDDLCAVNQCRRQLLGILVNRLHHALRVLNLVNRILQLPVEHLPVGDDDHAIVSLGILIVVQAGEAVRQPRNAVSLPAACRMLD